MSKRTIEDLKWKGNSEAMYNAVIDAMPPLFKAAVKKKINVWINKYNIETVTEKDVLDTVENYAPEQFKDQLIPLVQKLKTE